MTKTASETAFIQNPTTGEQRGANIRALMRRHGLTLKQFAQMAKINHQTLNAWINGGKTKNGWDVVERSSPDSRAALMRAVATLEPRWTAQQAHAWLGVPEEVRATFPWPPEASSGNVEKPKREMARKILVDEVSGELARPSRIVIRYVVGGDGDQLWISDTEDSSGKIVCRIARIAEPGLKLSGWQHLGGFAGTEPYNPLVALAEMVR